MNIIYILDIIGTFVFAISGALAAEEHDLDAFGVT
ncbi:MAG: TRIC cation channel family protein, partial [Thermoflexibacter sp.]|nr:TRIC cation channel family protein [Thermoflexibacter sp.]